MRLHRHPNLAVERILEQLERDGVSEQDIEPFAARAAARTAPACYAATRAIPPIRNAAIDRP